MAPWNGTMSPLRLDRSEKMAATERNAERWCEAKQLPKGLIS
jgi:hypothetical protein